MSAFYNKWGLDRGFEWHWVARYEAPEVDTDGNVIRDRTGRYRRVPVDMTDGSARIAFTTSSGVEVFVAQATLDASDGLMTFHVTSDDTSRIPHHAEAALIVTMGGQDEKLLGGPVP